jgi:hypothetical protein
MSKEWSASSEKGLASRSFPDAEPLAEGAVASGGVLQHRDELRSDKR